MQRLKKLLHKIKNEFKALALVSQRSAKMHNQLVILVQFTYIFNEKLIKLQALLL